MFLGGVSVEREVSLRTGAAVAAALCRKGYDVREIDIREDWVGVIKGAGVDVAFIALHGRFGEDGCIQAVCELASLPYTGSGVVSSAVAMSKAFSKRLVAVAGVPCMPDEVYEGPQRFVAEPPSFGFPLVVKPEQGGSAIWITIVRDMSMWKEAVELAVKHDSIVLAEKYVAGREITVSIVNDRVFPAIEIVPKSGVYDYHSKYTPEQTEYLIPAPMERDILERASEYTRRVAKTLRLRGAARVDYMVDRAGNVFFLEVNTIPGMTETSLLPKAAKFDGMSFEELVEEILSDAGLSK
ncbi:MAG: D-alanine--D-alanine ligase [Syntrophorhabdaceae bacterium]|nr:D-alanine--D-alanine ligase [Syntrophorhabdaceae bacterium]